MANSEADPVGLVLQIQRMSTEDGPGLRSTAFLKGCPLRCSWCHNPESISFAPEVQWIGSRCIAGAASDGCGACVAACPEGALSRRAAGALTAGAGVAAGDAAPGELLIDRAACARAARGHGLSCGAACAAACPSGAMELLGGAMRASQLARELLKDRSYFARSDRGGITLSGGEASAQGKFAREVLRRAKEAGIHTALDTCGFAPWDALRDLYPFVDLLLWDLKESDPGRHREFVGAPLEPVIENLRRTAAAMSGGEGGVPASIWIRTPIVPGATDREEGIEAIGRILAEIDPPGLERWELCAFNRLGADKYRRLGRAWKHAETPRAARGDMERLARAAERGLGRRGIVSWTGAVSAAESAGRAEEGDRACIGTS